MSKKTNQDHKLCSEINGLLVDHAAQELTADDARQVEMHLDSCRDCREEFMLLQRLEADSLQIEDACAAAMATIDWEASAEAITGRIPFEEPAVSYGPRRNRARRWGFGFNFQFGWKLLAPAMAGVLLLGIWLGYLFFHVSPHPMLPGPGDPSSGESMARLENTLARKEMAGYFQQSQLVLTDLMTNCNTDGSFSMQDQVDMRRVRKLLSKSRYVHQNADDPRFMSNKELLDKLDWLLYEILMTDTQANRDITCEKMQKLQDYIREEKLLFKLRLADKELSLDEV